MIETTFMLITLACMTGCDNVDNVIPYEDSQVVLYGEWWLIGWNNEGIRYEVNSNYVGHRHFSIEIPREGSVKAYSFANEARRRRVRHFCAPSLLILYMVRYCN